MAGHEWEEAFKMKLSFIFDWNLAPQLLSLPSIETCQEDLQPNFSSKHKWGNKNYHNRINAIEYMQ